MSLGVMVMGAACVIVYVWRLVIFVFGYVLGVENFRSFKSRGCVVGMEIGFIGFVL